MLKDKSTYRKEHEKVALFVKEQTGIDLNEYRDGDGTSPFTTTFWELNGPKLCVNWCGSAGGMPETVKNRLRQLVSRTTLKMEYGGAWFKYLYFDNQVI